MTTLEMLDEELADTLARPRRRKPARAPETPPADRGSLSWQRIRQACGHAADYIDLDRHADSVWLTVEQLRGHQTGPGRPTCAGSATEARQGEE